MPWWKAWALWPDSASPAVRPATAPRRYLSWGICNRTRSVPIKPTTPTPFSNISHTTTSKPLFRHVAVVSFNVLLIGNSIKIAIGLNVSSAVSNNSAALPLATTNSPSALLPLSLLPLPSSGLPDCQQTLADQSAPGVGIFDTCPEHFSNTLKLAKLMIKKQETKI